MSPNPKFDQSHWLLEVNGDGKPIVVQDMTFFKLCEQMNGKYGTHGWEIHDREMTGALAAKAA